MKSRYFYGVAARDLFWITILSDNRRVSTANLLHATHLSNIYDLVG